MNLLKEAEDNLGRMFLDNPHRGIVSGLNEDGSLIQMAWIMGRSPGSQNRTYVKQGTDLRTEAIDPSKVREDQRDLIIYRAMTEAKGLHIVSNGNHTEDIAGFARNVHPASRHLLPLALRQRYCEPDAPIFTPRIAAYQNCLDSRAVFMTLRADPAARERWTVAEAEMDKSKFPTNKSTFDIALTPGFGYCMMTYAPGDSNALKSYDGSPFVVPLHGSANQVIDRFWKALDERWRVAIGMKVANDGAGVNYILTRDRQKG